MSLNSRFREQHAVQGEIQWRGRGPAGARRPPTRSGRIYSTRERRVGGKMNRPAHTRPAAEAGWSGRDSEGGKGSKPMTPPTA